MHVDMSQEALLGYMPDVLGYKERLRTFDRQWVRITLTGKINSNRVASTLIDFMEGTQNKFLALQDNLIKTLVAKNCDKAIQEMSGLSRVAIDILKRNLFERTADVGFLATDDDIVNFLCLEDADADARTTLEERLRAYRDKYTVYNDILVLDLDGNIRARLDRTCADRRSADPLLGRTLATDGYVETFRPSDLRPDCGNVLLYSQRIQHPGTGAPLGVLCLCFDFTGEMEGIYAHLLGHGQARLCILDDQGKVISSSDPAFVAPGSTQSMVLDATLGVVSQRGTACLTKTARTQGYQGFVGLPWFGHVLCPVEKAFQNSEQSAATEEDLERSDLLVSGELQQIDDDADDILSDLGLVVLNGEVMAAKQIANDDPVIRQEANALPPVLGAIHQVGENIRGVFAQSIASLLDTELSSRLDDLAFLASLAIDIMDRNLYERANDCRWWALDSTFRRVLAKDRIDEGDRRRLGEILAYINGLYTVYTNLILYDRAGVVAAVSDPAAAGLVGRPLQHDFVRQCLQLDSPARYVVSPFAPAAEYAGPDGAPRPTYIYNAAVFHPEAANEVVGGIAIVFDSAPQFQAMLEDALPRVESCRVDITCEGFFLDRGKRILSTTSAGWRVGDVLPLDVDLATLPQGQTRSGFAMLGGERRIFGCAMSEGYREYKRDGVYTNDVAAVMLGTV